MSRKPTGNPTGRPLHSGQLGLGIADDQERLSIRIPRELYTRFEAFAAGRSFHRGTPQLAPYIREAMEEYLLRHTSRQTASITLSPSDSIGQPENVLASSRDAMRQPDRETPAQPDTEDICQTENMPVVLEQPGEPLRQPESTPVALEPVESTKEPGEPPPRLYGSLTERVKQAIAPHRRFTCREIAHHLGENPKAVHQVLQPLVKDRTLRYQRAGKTYINRQRQATGV
jgi:hypothetical protein